MFCNICYKMLEIKPFVKCYTRYNIQSCLVTQGLCPKCWKWKNSAFSRTPPPRIMWGSFTIVCPPLFVLLLSPTRPCFSISSIHRNIDHPPWYLWYPISVKSNICDICDTRPPSRYRPPTHWTDIWFWRAFLTLWMIFYVLHKFPRNFYILYFPTIAMHERGNWRGSYLFILTVLPPLQQLRFPYPCPISMSNMKTDLT